MISSGQLLVIGPSSYAGDDAVCIHMAGDAELSGIHLS